MVVLGVVLVVQDHHQNNLQDHQNDPQDHPQDPL